ncbi:unnamed protein product [Phytomonas sp. EM1]|nr:unnamed protein product [Phytomonas sp. EM1]|eukprot:CCW62111.1 unnamed protein product [Phytomonas sp. isolate EM1]
MAELRTTFRKETEGTLFVEIINMSALEKELCDKLLGQSLHQ